MAETLLQFQTPILAPDATPYWARACGTVMDDGLWQGWLEFTPAGDGPVLRSGRETTQPNRGDLMYWATGLSPVYLEGALRRALEGPVKVLVTETNPPAFEGPEPSVPIVGRESPSGAHAVLDPFSIFEKGEALLRKQLGALSSWHLVNVIVEYELSDESAAVLNQLRRGDLIDLIVTAVRKEAAAGSRRPV